MTTTTTYIIITIISSILLIKHAHKLVNTASTYNVIASNHKFTAEMEKRQIAAELNAIQPKEMITN